MTPLPHDPGPHWGEVGIHGLHRQREWDAVTVVEAPGIPGDEARLVALPGGRVVREDGSAAAAELVTGVALAPPFRLHAVRREGDLWAVAARRIDVVDLPRDPGGDRIEVAWDGVERTVRIDGEPTLVGVVELERLGGDRHEAYVVTAARLEGTTWEVAVAPL